MNFVDFSQKPPARGAPHFAKSGIIVDKSVEIKFFAMGRRDWDSRLVTIVKIKVSEQTIAKKQKLRCERTPTDQNWSKRGAILEQNGALFGEKWCKNGGPRNVRRTDGSGPPRSSCVVFQSPLADERARPPTPINHKTKHRKSEKNNLFFWFCVNIQHWNGNEEHTHGNKKWKIRMGIKSKDK